MRVWPQRTRPVRSAYAISVTLDEAERRVREQEQSTIRKREEYVTYDLFAVSCCGLRNCVLCL